MSIFGENEYGVYAWGEDPLTLSSTGSITIPTHYLTALEFVDPDISGSDLIDLPWNES